MRIKIYTCPGMPEAIARIRAELGDDAVIIGSRRVEGGIEVTAAREDLAPEPEASLVLPGRKVPPPVAPPALRPPVSPLALMAKPAPTPAAEPADRASPAGCLLAAHGTPERLAAKLRGGPLPFALSVAFRYAPLDADVLARPIAFIGPPGAGKTLTVARLAARMVREGLHPTVLTSDTSRACAWEQLAAYTTLLDLPLAPYSQHPTPTGPVLIDTAGIDPFAPGDQSELTDIIKTSGALAMLVLPAGMDPGEAIDMAEGFAACGASRLVATRCDIARRMGGILAAAQRLPLAEAGVGTSGEDSLIPLSAQKLAALLQRRPANRRLI